MASRNVLIVLVFLLISFSSMAQDDFRWKNRIIYLQSNDFDMVHEQIIHFRNHNKELEERQTIVFSRVGKSIYKGLEMEKAILPRVLQNMDERHFFTLIGLDGGVKLREQSIVKIERLNNIVDAMPMRQNELRLRQY